MDEVRFGIIGIGNMGSTYLYKTFGEGQVQGGRVSAVCDIDPSRLDGVREKLGDSIAYFSDYHEMLASGLIDAVMIETPHYIHPDIAIEALGRGIHTLCDKPAGVYTKQVEEMNEAARRSSAVFGIMFNQRMNGVYKRMREMIAEGGKLIYTKNKIDGMEFLRTTDKLFGKPETERIEVECEACENMHAAIINNFIARILGKEELVAPGEEGVRGVELMNAIELSGWLGGERVTLPIDGERYLALLSEKRATSRAKTVRAVGPTCTEGSY